MYNSLTKVFVLFTEYGISNSLAIDNEKNTLTYNNKSNRINSNELSNFLDTFFRIARSWNDENTFKISDHNFMLNMIILENEKEYNLSLSYIPDNFDSFLDLINKYFL